MKDNQPQVSKKGKKRGANYGHHSGPKGVSRMAITTKNKARRAAKREAFAIRRKPIMALLRVQKRTEKALKKQKQRELEQARKLANLKSASDVQAI